MIFDTQSLLKSGKVYRSLVFIQIFFSLLLLHKDREQKGNLFVSAPQNKKGLGLSWLCWHVPKRR